MYVPYRRLSATLTRSNLGQALSRWQEAADGGEPHRTGGDLHRRLAASLHLFAAFGIATPVDLNGRQFLAGPYAPEPAFKLSAGVATVPSGPGLGIGVDEELIRELSLEQHESN